MTAHYDAEFPDEFALAVQEIRAEEEAGWTFVSRRLKARARINLIKWSKSQLKKLISAYPSLDWNVAAWKNYILTGDPEQSPPTWPHRTIEVTDPFQWPIDEPFDNDAPVAANPALPVIPPVEAPPTPTTSTVPTPPKTSAPPTQPSSPKPCRTGPFRPAEVPDELLTGQLLGTFGTFAQCEKGILKRPWPSNPKYTEVLVPGGLLYATMSDRAMATAKRIPVQDAVRRRLIKAKLAGPDDQISLLPAYPKRERKQSDRSVYFS